MEPAEQPTDVVDIPNPQEPNPPSEPEFDKTKFYTNAYNDGKSKALKDLKGLGIESESYDEALEFLKNRLTTPAPSDEPTTDPNELELLRNKLAEATKRAEEVSQQFDSYKTTSSKKEEYNTAFSSINDVDLVLDQKAIEILFETEYNVEMDNGAFVVKGKNGIPEIDDSGNRKSLPQAIKDFVVKKGYATPKAQGVGGSVSPVGTTIVTKPSRTEFNKLVQSSSAKDHSKAAELRERAKKVGWSE